MGTYLSIMLLEALTTAAMPARTPSDRRAKRMGFLYESIAISARYSRNFRKWRPHLQACKKHIADSISMVPATGRIVILGSGAWHDMPVSKLARHGAQIDLVDIVHLPLARMKAKLHSNFNLIEADLTGYAEAYDKWDGRADSLPEPPAVAPFSIERADLVISLNILSQLPIAFTASPPASEAEARLASALQWAHLDALGKVKGRVLLISDHHRTEITSKEIHEIPTVQKSLLPDNMVDSWAWHIAPLGEVDRDTDIKLRVGVWKDFNIK